MSKKTDTYHFLRKEAKALADSKGMTVVAAQASFDDTEANKVKVKDKKVKI